MFSLFDHLMGAITVRIRRFFLSVRGKPDISSLNKNICLGGVSNIKSLAENGIRAILDLREETQDDEEELKKYDISYLKIKIAERSIPDNEDVNKALDWISVNLEQRKKIFIHCNLGRGRAPMMSCLYLISNGMSNKKGILQIKKIRKYTYFNSNQLEFIQNFRYQK